MVSHCLAQVNNMEGIPYVCANTSDASSKLVPYENFTYSNNLLGCILAENLKTTNFTGTSVSVIQLA
jgi:hypothetical protein